MMIHNPAIMTMWPKLKSRRAVYTFPPPITNRIFLPLINFFKGDPSPATNIERFMRSVQPLTLRPGEVDILDKGLEELNCGGPQGGGIYRSDYAPRNATNKQGSKRVAKSD